MIDIDFVNANVLKIRELEYNVSDISVIEFSDVDYSNNSLTVTVDIKRPLEKVFVRFQINTCLYIQMCVFIIYQLCINWLFFLSSMSWSYSESEQTTENLQR